MTAKLTVWVRESRGTSLIVSSTRLDPSEESAKGEMCLRFRRTYKPERLLFSFRSLYPALDPQTGFSGFSARGDVIIDQKEVLVRPNGWVGHYHLDRQPDAYPWREW